MEIIWVHHFLIPGCCFLHGYGQKKDRNPHKLIEKYIKDQEGLSVLGCDR